MFSCVFSKDIKYSSDRLTIKTIFFFWLSRSLLTICFTYQQRIVEILLRNPKNSQLLYRPNRSGETPYNIDLSNQKTILGQIFGARKYLICVKVCYDEYLQGL